MRRPRVRRRDAALRSSLLILAGIVALAGPALVIAAQSWTITTSASSVETGSPTDIDLTISNTSDGSGGGESIGCVRVWLPSQFTVDSVTIASVTNGLIWSVTTSGSGPTLVEATAEDDGERLRGDPDLDVLVLTIGVTGGASGSYSWVADEYEKPDCSQNHDQQVSLPMDIDTGVNDAPVAVDDAYSGPHDRDLNVGAPGVLGNDTDADLDALTAVLGTTTGNGTLSLAADGSFSYTPDPGFVGSDSFTYRADDGSVPSGLATVTIDVTDAAPVAVADAYTVDKNASISVGAGTGVLANDTDPDAGETLTASVVSGPTDGSVTLAPDGSFDYTPDPGFSGTDSFTYQVSDGALTDTATASIDVVNQAPSAADDLYTGPKNLPLIVNAASGVLANDVDPNGDPLSASVVTGPSSGVLLLSANGGFTYTPITGFEGTDQFTYQATDGTATTTATVTIAVANDAPVAVDDSASVIHDRTLVVAAPGVLGNDTDANGDSLVSSVVTGPSSGSLTLDPDGGYTYSPDPGFIGTDSFSYRVDDGAATSGLATVTLSVTNVGPTANSDGYTGSKSMPLVVPVGSGVLADDVDPDGDALAAAVSSAPSNGTLLLAADGSFSYTPTAGFIGTDTFDYTVSDGITSATATVTITISNAAPTGADDSYDAFRNRTLAVAAAGVLANDTDGDGDSLAAILLVAPSKGTLTLGSGGGFSYVPNPGYVGPDAFVYRASDGTAMSAPATVSITVANRKPVAVDDSATVDAGGSIGRSGPGLLSNDDDADGDPLVALLGTAAANGTAVVRSDGGWSYTPDDGFAGADSFTYVAFDGLATSTAATVEISVIAPAATPEPTPASPPPPAQATQTPVAPTPTPELPSPSPTSSPEQTSTPVPSVAPEPPPPTGGAGGAEPFAIPDVGSSGIGTDDMGLAAAALTGFGPLLWAVPSLILSVPGLLLVIAILAQAAGGLAWLPLVRRKLGGFGVRGDRRLRGRSMA